MDARQVRNRVQNTNITGYLRKSSHWFRTYLVILIIWQFRSQFLTHQQTRLIRPGSSHIPHGVTTTSQNKSRHVEALNEIDTVGMAAHAYIETTQPVSLQTNDT